MHDHEISEDKVVPVVCNDYDLYSWNRKGLMPLCDDDGTPIVENDQAIIGTIDNTGEWIEELRVDASVLRRWVGNHENWRSIEII